MKKMKMSRKSDTNQNIVLKDNLEWFHNIESSYDKLLEANLNKIKYVWQLPKS